MTEVNATLLIAIATAEVITTLAIGELVVYYFNKTRQDEE